MHPRPETHPSGRLRVCPLVWFSSGGPRWAGSRSAYPIVRSRSKCNRRLGSSQPELASSKRTLGPKSTCEAPSLFRQRGGEKECCCWHLVFGLLFTRPADQPRHATSVFSNPVDPGSPPFVFVIDSPQIRHDQRRSIHVSDYTASSRKKFRSTRNFRKFRAGRPADSRILISSAVPDRLRSRLPRCGRHRWKGAGSRAWSPWASCRPQPGSGRRCF